jgi:hypothetical protein
MENEKQCKHIYESRIIKKQERSNQYLGEGKYDIITLEQEEHYIFCNKCGDIKKVELDK